MNVEQAIKMLEEVKIRFGNVEVYWDCPNCGKSYSPDILQSKAVVHLSEPKK